MTFDEYVNLGLWIAVWVAAVFYAFISKLGPSASANRFVGVLIALIGVAVLLRLGVPGGENPLRLLDIP